MNSKTLLTFFLVALTTGCSSKGSDKPSNDNISTSPVVTSQPKSSPVEANENEVSTPVATTEETKTTKQPSNPEEDLNSNNPVLASQVANGAIDSSGGNLTNSTEAQVKLFLVPEFLEKFLITAVTRMEMIAFNPEDSALLAPLLKGNETVDKTLLMYIRSADFKNVRETDCLDSHTGEKRDASVTARGRFCFDIKRMQRIPFESLQLEIVALVMHELAHIYGYDEENALLVQNLVRTQRMRIFPDQRSIDTIYFNLRDVRSTLIDVERDFGVFSRAHDCSTIGMATGMARSWHSMFEQTWGGISSPGAAVLTNQPSYLPRSAELNDWATEMIHLNRNFCLFLPEQSDDEFLQKMIVIRAQLEDILKTIELFVRA